MSHRPRPKRDASTTPNTTVPRRVPPSRPGIETKNLPSENRRIGLPSSPQANLAISSSIPVRQRPSALPRSTSSGPAPRRLNPSAAKSSRPAISSGALRPPLIQTKSAPEDVPLVYDDSSYSHSRSDYLPTTLDPANDTVLGIAMPDKGVSRSQNLPPRLIPELQALAGHNQRPSYPPPPTSVSTISSPSTRFTESPAPWSAGTTTTTPASWSSASPALTSSYGMRTPEKKSKTVPAPNPPRSRLPKLPSTQRPTPPPKTLPGQDYGTQTAEERGRPTRKKPILSSPPPTPPPRRSSIKRPGTGGRSGSNSVDDTLSKGVPSGPSTRPSTAPSSADRNTTSHATTLGPEDRIDFSAFTAHNNLQQSIQTVPSRPSRSGTFDLGESRPTIINTHKAAFRPQHRQLLESGFEDVTPHTKIAASAPLSDTERSTTSDQWPRSPSRLGKFSKLRIFGQRNPSSTDVDKSPKKLQRRGPAAGTGHEGYGKYAKRGRKQSTETSGTGSETERSQSSTRRIPLFSHSRKTSTASRRASQSDVDEFAVPRLKPVIMRGGSQTSVATDQFDHDRAYFTSPDLRTTPSPALEQAPTVHDERARSPLGNLAVGADSPAQDTQIPRLALRRSQRFGQGTEPMRLPAPIRTDDQYVTPVINSFDTSLSSTMPSSAAPSLPPNEVRIDPALLKEKKARRRWWNPFRPRYQDAVVQEPVRTFSTELEMAYSIATGPAPRSIPYYAMLESESEGTDAQQIGDYMFEAAKPSQSPSPEQQEEAAVSPRKKDSILLPAPPVWSSEDLATPPAGQLDPARPETPSRPSRLAQVGRIPKVVSRSERQHKPSRQSFSQPFARGHPLQKPGDPGHNRQQSQDEPPQLQIHTDVLPSRPFREAENLSAKPSSAPARSHPPHTGVPEPITSELAQVSSMHSSDVSTSSSSAGMISVLRPAIIPTSYEMQTQQHMPIVRPPSMYEDVWNEFDDIIDHVMSPSRSPRSKSPPVLLKAPPRPLAEAASGSPLIGYPNVRPVSRDKLTAPEPRRAKVDLPLGTRGTPPVVFPSPLLLSDKSIGDEIRLRRSRIVSALHSSYDPSSPFSMREFLKDYSEGRDSLGLSQRLSSSTAARSTLTGLPLKEEPEEERTHQDNAILLDVAERSKDPAQTSELHYASLEVSRWLSFGRVLFSPAQNEINTLPDRNVLVIDGLGSEDWSIYCAVTYETARAVVYDLKETSHHKKPASPQELDHLPRNHRRAEIASFGERFPFHSAFFSVIVLRFPPAMSEAKMKNIITECRRILVPGGHIEVMLLELDFVNMGVQTRRAVRELKMRMATKDSDVNLKPTIDNFQSLLGGRGFVGLNRCVVGVPVAGKAPGSTDSSTSSRSSGGSYARRPSDPTHLTGRQHQRNQNFSLSDLVADPSESADAQIGRMVSKAARNWWQHCYEAAVIPNGDLSRSIFSEKKVLRECKMRASSFKLLIAYAQRPVFETRRRTMSETAAPTMATAGGARRPKAP